MEQLELLCILLVRMQYIASFENNLAVLYEAKNNTFQRIQKSQLLVFNLEGKKTCSHKNLYIIVHGSFTHNHQKWKEPKCYSNGEWMNEL